MDLHHRFLWLTVIPTGACLASWGVVFIGSPHESPVVAIVIAGLLPLAGLAAVPAYRWYTDDHVRVLPYVPLTLVAVAFAASMVELAAAVAREPDGAFIPVLQVGLGFVLPFLAFACGLAGFILTAPRSTA
jgi:hypothetical protein